MTRRVGTPAMQCGELAVIAHILEVACTKRLGHELPEHGVVLHVVHDGVDDTVQLEWPAA